VKKFNIFLKNIKFFEMSKFYFFFKMAGSYFFIFKKWQGVLLPQTQKSAELFAKVVFSNSFWTIYRNKKNLRLHKKSASADEKGNYFFSQIFFGFRPFYGNFYFFLCFFFEMSNFYFFILFACFSVFASGWICHTLWMGG
jgi:hypothetical protein